MNKQQALESLQSAKTAHIQWRARAQALVAGVSVAQEQVPVIYTECKFGKWYYGAGQSLNFLESFRAVEDPHEQLHNVYMKIFNILFGEDHRSFLSSLFTSKRKHDAVKLAEAQKLLDHLVAISRTLLEAIELLEKDITALPDEAQDGKPALRAVTVK
jgi:nicotinate-nucleotide pyrophosphorylase